MAWNTSWPGLGLVGLPEDMHPECGHADEDGPSQQGGEGEEEERAHPVVDRVPRAHGEGPKGGGEGISDDNICRTFSNE